MVTQKQAYDHYLNMYNIGSIYVWGFNSGTIITEKSIEKAYKSYGTSKYNKAYYDAKLKEGKGKNGSDCSGAHYPISGYDTTAQGYYNKCTKTGKISTMPRDKVVLLFRGTSTSSIVHTGVYLPGKGAFHMKSSAENAALEPIEKTTFNYWGYANFIDYKSPDVDFFDLKQWTKDLQTVLNYNYKAKLVVDGIFGSGTLKAVTDVGVLKKGSRSSVVTQLQKFLNYYNKTELTLDGDFGQKTHLGVLMFQKSQKLTQDGQVGPNTWKAIQAICKKG